MDKTCYISQLGTWGHHAAHPLRALDCAGLFAARHTVTRPQDDTEANALGFLERDMPTLEGQTAVSGWMSRRGWKDDRHSQEPAMEAYSRVSGLAMYVRRPAIGGDLHGTRGLCLFLRDRIAKRALHHLSVARLAPLPQAERRGRR